MTFLSSFNSAALFRCKMEHEIDANDKKQNREIAEKKKEKSKH